MQIRHTLLFLFALILPAVLPAQDAKPTPMPAPGLDPTASPAPTSGQSTISRIRAANQLHCGLTSEIAEYSNLDAHGNRAVFDVDLCKSVAVAILGPGARFAMTPFPDEKDLLTALRDGKIDFAASASPSIANQTGASVTFARPVLYDFQGILVNRSLNAKSARDLAGKKICYLVETQIEENFRDYMARQQVKFIPFPFQEEGEMEAAFITGNCVALSADVTQLAYERIAFRNMAKNFEILPDVVAKDPLAPATRTDDPAFSAIVYAVSNALIEAEELGITQANVEDKKKSTDSNIQRFLGVTFGIGKPLGLDDAWAARTIQAVGNYGEIFDRDLGPKSPHHLDRGPNRLWTDGGLMISTAFP